jgi:adenine/guanine/hypoxanthine permease
MRFRFVRGDLDGFFGLFIDNLLQLMLIDVLCRHVVHLPDALITGRILPGAAVSILTGNLFYAWQARRLMERTGRTDVTALPYGINTVSLLAFVFLIMGPIYQETKDPLLAWHAGLFACLLSGVMEILGAFAGDWLRRNTPRAALLSALGGIAITFISMGFVFQIFASPSVAVVPLMIILIAYAGRVRLPFGVPGGLAAIAVGTALAWGLRAAGHSPLSFSGAAPSWGFHPPVPVPKDLFALFSDERGWRYLAVIFPMGLFNIIGSLQNLESAHAAGDAYDTRSSLLANGVGRLWASKISNC